MSIKHEHALNPVTALEFYYSSAGKLLLLAGEGSFLKVFEAETSQLLFQHEIFPNQVIHGIATAEGAVEPHDLQVVIWGGKRLALFKKCDFDRFLDRSVSTLTGTTALVSDWILDVAISDDDKNRCVLVTAHNKLIHAKLEGDGQTPFLEDLPSPFESILYSAQVIWDTQSQILVAAGTVFGQVIVWQCSVTREGAFGDARPLFTFTGHEGSIFGVNISPPILDGEGRKSRLLASCSDDRTIRVWSLSDPPQKSKQKNEESSLRETGFGKNNQYGNESLSDENCVATVMGHASRIWRVKFLVEKLDASNRPAVSVLSFGEDATTQQWRLEPAINSNICNTEKDDLQASNGLINHKFRLFNTNIFEFHSGKHIWSTALRQGPDRIFNLATGGADGKISLYNMDMLSAQVRPSMQGKSAQPQQLDLVISGDSSPLSRVCELEDVFTSLLRDNNCSQPPPIQTQPDPPPDASPILPLQEGKMPTKKKTQKLRKDAFNRYAFISERQFLATTSLGRVLLCEVSTDLEWKEIHLPEPGREDLKSYAVIKGFPEISSACLAGTSGKIYIYRGGNSISELGSVEGKVADMFKIFDPETATFNLLVTTLASKEATLFPIGSAVEIGLQTPEVIFLRLPDGFVVTSAEKCQSLLVLGSRKGSLAAFDLRRPNNPLYTWNDPECIVGDAITTILPLPSSRDKSDKKGYFLTTGRNGIYTVFSSSSTPEPNTESHSTKLQPLHRGTPPLGPVIEAAWFEDDMLILHGFKGKKFVAWNETKQYEIISVECGGAHRSYAYSSLSHVEGGCIFIYTKASKLYVHLQRKLPLQIIKQGGHGREIKTCSVSPDGRLLATGSEDTAIRIWRYDDRVVPEHNQLNCLAVVQKHGSGIQCLQWYQSRYLFSSGGSEEFFIWAIEEIPGFGIGVVCEATCPDPSADRDLRIMRFDVTEAPDALGFEKQPALLISLAYSDSTVRTYTYTKNSGYNLVASGRYTSSCIFQIKHVHVADNFLHFLTAATDGYLTLWKCQVNYTTEAENHNPHSNSSELVMLSNIRIHQNAIKSLDSAALSTNNRILVVTAGDDNAIGMSVYSIQDMSHRPETFILKSAHAAAITGLCVMPAPTIENGREVFCIISSGNDQRVKKWALYVDQQNAESRAIEIQQTGDVFTSVADVGDMAVLGADMENNNTQKRILLVGNGMEVWNVS